jgi:sugar-specific transcriptional regulator TrmB
MGKYSTDLKLIFSQLNLSEESAKIYYESLKLGKATVAEIARNAGLARSSCYDILDRLKRTGFISTTKDKNTTYIIAENPELISQLLSKKKDSIKKAFNLYYDISNHLNILGKREKSGKVDVRIFKGFISMKNLLFEMLNKYKSEEFLNICQGEADKFAGLSRDPKYLKEYIHERNKFKIKERAILEDMKSAREFKKIYESKDFQIILSPQLSNQNTAHIDKFIIKDIVFIFNFEGDYAVVIKDKYIAENERITFNALWKTLKKNN